MKSPVIAFVLIGLLAFLAICGVYLHFSAGNATAQTAAAAAGAIGDVSSAVSSAQAASAPERARITPPEPTGVRRYENSAYHFALSYPEELSVKEYPENNGALTIIFEKSATEGFQVYVTPYAGNTVNAARFKLDEPSGVYRDPTAITIDGVRGTAFFGWNDVMADTREVWFIKDGFLYEVTTYKELDAWLSTILATWKFLPSPAAPPSEPATLTR